MKLTVVLLSAAAITLTSCSSLDPEYAEYKKQKEAEAAAGLGASADPYGTPGANPYGVPGQGADVGTYTPQTPAAPYQPLPGVNPNLPSGGDPYGAPAPRAGFPTIPGPGAPTGPTTAHVVTKGDSIWGLSRKYNVSQEAIRAANGIQGDRIIAGSTIQIPRN